MAPIISFSGIASGFDTRALIDALIERERVTRIKPLQAKSLDLSDTNDSLSKLSGLLEKLKASADKFRAVNGGALTTTGSSSDETAVSISTNNFAQNATYSISVNQLAKNATLTLASTSVTYGSGDQAINSSINDSDPNRSVTIQVGSGSEQETIDIELTSASTLNDFVTQFNNSSTKAVATLVNVGNESSPDYRITINSNNSGLSNGQISLSVGSEISDPDGNGGTDDGAFNDNVLSQATDAEFSLGGIGTITRSTNSVSDVISGITFNLKGVGSATVSVSNDTTASSQSIQDFVSAYNEVVNYIKENDLVSQQQNGEDTLNIFGPLARTSLDESIVTSLRSSLLAASKTGGEINTLADLGITTERDGTLNFDSSAFESAVSNEPNSARSILENLGEALASTATGSISQYTRFNGLIDFSINANKDSLSSIESNIADIEKSLSQQEDALSQRFSRLESLIGRLQSQQSALISILPRSA